MPRLFPAVESRVPTLKANGTHAPLGEAPALVAIPHHMPGQTAVETNSLFRTGPRVVPEPGAEAAGLELFLVGAVLGNVADLPAAEALAGDVPLPVPAVLLLRGAGAPPRGGRRQRDVEGAALHLLLVHFPDAAGRALVVLEDDVGPPGGLAVVVENEIDVDDGADQSEITSDRGNGCFVGQI